MGAAVAAIGCAPEARLEQAPGTPPARERAQPQRPVEEPTVRVVAPDAGARDVDVDVDVVERARAGVHGAVAASSPVRVGGVRSRAAVVDALRRLDARMTRARVDQLRGRAEFDPIELERLEALHARCHELMGSVELSLDPEPAELDRRARRLERDVARALASRSDEARGG
jgi:5-carboxymethyl-2-hydroxymuconate isomerase